MSQQELYYNPRELKLNKKETVRKREEGFIPGVLFGKSIESTPIFINKKKTNLSHLHRGSVFSVTVGSKKFMATCKEIQRDHLGKFYQHICFHVVEGNVEIESEVPLKLVGSAIGEKSGGVVQTIIKSIDIKAKPKDIPECLELDISALELNETLCVSDLKLPPGVVISHMEEDETLVSCKVPKVQVEELVAEEVVEESASEEVPEVEEPTSEESEEVKKAA